MCMYVFSIWIPVHHSTLHNTAMYVPYFSVFEYKVNLEIPRFISNPRICKYSSLAIHFTLN